MSIIRTGLPILVELINLVNSVIIFLSQMTLLGRLTFLLGSQTAILIALLFRIYFFLLILVFVLQWLSLHWEILIMLLSQFPLTFHQIHNGMARFIAQRMTLLLLIGMVFVINRSSLTHRKYQVKPRTSPWFSASCAAAIVQRNHFFRLYQKYKSSDSKVTFRQASNRCKPSS